MTFFNWGLDIVKIKKKGIRGQKGQKGIIPSLHLNRFLL